MCTANPPEWAIQQQISGDQQGASNINLEQPGALISSSSKSLTSDCSISVEAAEVELIRLEAPDTEAVGLRDALQRLVLEGRVGAGKSQTLADQVSAQVGSFGKVRAPRPADRADTAVVVGTHFLAGDEAPDLEVEGRGGAVAAESRAQLSIAELPRVGDINAEQPHHPVLDNERCVFLKDGVAAEFRRARACAEHQRDDQDRQQSEHFISTACAGVRLAGSRRQECFIVHYFNGYIMALKPPGERVRHTASRLSFKNERYR